MGRKVVEPKTNLAVAYCRVSTDHEEQLESIKKQQEQWLDFFEQRKVTNAEMGILCHRQQEYDSKKGKMKKGKFVLEPRVDGLYIDEGTTGTAVKNRRAFQQMIDDALARKFDMIYVEDVSRFSRSVEDFTKTIKDLREVGVYVYFKKEQTSTEDPKNDSALTLRITFAQEESRMKQDRSKWAIGFIHRKGGWHSHAPYGYYAEASMLYVDEEEAEVVRKIFELYAYEHWGIGKICRYLDSEGIPSKNDTGWAQQVVRRMLVNSIYIGEQRTHIIETYDLTRHTRRAVPENEQILTYKKELAIVDKDTFNLAQEELERRSKEFSKGNGVSTKHALSTLVYCDYCKGVFKRKKRHTYSRKDGTSKDIGYEWTCQLTDMYGATAKAKAGRCSGGRNAIKEDELFEAIKYEITNLKEQKIDYKLEQYLEAKYKRLEELNVEELEQERQQAVNATQELLKLKLDGKIAESTYDTLLEDYDEKLVRFKKDIEAVKVLETEKERQVQLFNAYKKEIRKFDISTIKEYDTKTAEGAEKNARVNAQLKNIFHKIYVKYRVVDGEKIPYLRFVYNFLGTNDDMLESMTNGEDALHIWTRLDDYKMK